MLESQYIKSLRQYGKLAARTHKSYGDIVAALMLDWLLRAVPDGASDEERLIVVRRILATVANEYIADDPVFDPRGVLGFDQV